MDEKRFGQYARLHHLASALSVSALFGIFTFVIGMAYEAGLWHPRYLADLIGHGAGYYALGVALGAVLVFVGGPLYRRKTDGHWNEAAQEKMAETTDFELTCLIAEMRRLVFFWNPLTWWIGMLLFWFRHPVLAFPVALGTGGYFLGQRIGFPGAAAFTFALLGLGLGFLVRDYMSSRSSAQPS